MTRENSHQAIHEGPRPQRNPMLLVLVLSGVGVILLGLAWIFIADPGLPPASFKYTTADVVYDQPMQAVHNMSGSGLDSIPFLPKDGPQPKIRLLEEFHNYGSIGSTEVVSHDFVIANQGDAPLTISQAYTTCGCTTADFTATVIPPGKVSVVTMKYDAGFHDARGQTVRRGVIIENNDPKNPQVELWVQATVRQNP